MNALIINPNKETKEKYKEYEQQDNLLLVTSAKIPGDVKKILYAMIKRLHLKEEKTMNLDSVVDYLEKHPKESYHKDNQLHWRIRESITKMLVSKKNITKEDIKHLFIERDIDSNKGDFGKAGVLGGSENYIGALKLSYLALASLRSGTGLVRVLLEKELTSLIGPFILEQTLYPYEKLEELREGIKDLNSLAVGMGWTSSHLSTLEFILKNYTGTLIIDADGLNILAENLELLKDTEAKVVLTPHMKEFARLTSLTIEEINENKETLVSLFAKEHHVILVLKGHTTVISDGNNTNLVTCGTSGMATSGSGDVLSGILAGLLSYMPYHLSSVCAGVFLNGIAGEMATKEQTDIAMISSDTIKYIPQAIKEIRGERNERN